jgi:hypothetical protein
MLPDGFPRFGFLAVKVSVQTFTAVTRVRIPSGTPIESMAYMLYRLSLKRNVELRVE